MSEAEKSDQLFSQASLLSQILLIRLHRNSQVLFEFGAWLPKQHLKGLAAAEIKKS